MRGVFRIYSILMLTDLAKQPHEYNLHFITNVSTRAAIESEFTQIQNETFGDVSDSIASSCQLRMDQKRRQFENRHRQIYKIISVDSIIV